MNRLHELREELGLNQHKMAEALHMPYTTYRGYELGDRGMNSEILRKFADYFGVSIDYLICRSDDREKHTEPPEYEDDILSLRDDMLRRPELRYLMNLARDGRTSDILEASALLQRYKEESEGK